MVRKNRPRVKQSRKRRKSLRNPKARPSYYKNKKYLGKKVKDFGKVGLDRPKEFIQIAKKIKSDVKSGRISKKTARGRFGLLSRLLNPKKNSKIRGWSKRTRERVKTAIAKIRASAFS